LEAGFSASIETHSKFNLRYRAASKVGWSSSNGACSGVSWSSNYISLVVNSRNVGEFLHMGVRQANTGHKLDEELTVLIPNTALNASAWAPVFAATVLAAVCAFAQMSLAG